jgi:hypothetical protein
MPDPITLHLPDRLVATHEAGHAVAAVVLGLDLEYVDIRRGERPDGTRDDAHVFTKHPPLREFVGKGYEFARAQMVMTCAGPAAEVKISPLAVVFGAARKDYPDALRFAGLALSEVLPDDTPRPLTEAEEAERLVLFERAKAEAAAFVEEHWDAIQRVAARLVETKYLTGTQIAELVRGDV